VGEESALAFRSCGEEREQGMEELPSVHDDIKCDRDDANPIRCHRRPSPPRPDSSPHG
jgi:hypothetical protein